ncbi:carboxypeptidase-like regulatory domain-containing protein [Thermotoga sp. SG1]|uniref:carboxypeptidase-like regulatory domain-containing protein n=1 Tax=Thermotoga sp. SG1 TaxID=126739 RepID=UPI000C76B91E|nr:carboxypeptidase-like regulatory domain-containing protein [Thermotoga sp. SG1]PLV55750.1 hypothetical protein AS006_08950 [Thermotoga sp. SG1]
MERLRKVLVVALVVLGVVMALAFSYPVTDNYTSSPGKTLTLKLQVFPLGDPSTYTIVIGSNTYTFTKDGRFTLTCIPENTTINVKVYEGDVQTLVWERDIQVNRSKTVTITIPAGTYETISLSDYANFSITPGTMVDVYFYVPRFSTREDGLPKKSMSSVFVGTFPYDSIRLVRGDYNLFENADVWMAGSLSYRYRLIVKEPGFVPYELMALYGASGNPTDGIYYKNDLLSTIVEDIRTPWIDQNVALQGTVKDAQGNPIEGAIVAVYAGRYMMGSTTTDANGNYTLSGLPAGDLTIRASAQGYITSSLNFDGVENNTYTFDFVLQAR